MMGLSTSLMSIMLFCQTFRTVVCSKDNCTNPITKKVVVGYYCPADARTVQFANVPLHLCTHYCVSEFRCSMLSYYVNKGLCLVHNEICMEMVKDTQLIFSSIMLYGRQKQECISWLPFQGNIPDGKRFLRMYEGNHMAIRLHYNDEILPGRLALDRYKVKTVSLVNGPIRINQDPDAAVEFAVVSDTCSMVWVPYIAGHPIPQRAVVGGRNRNGGLLFVASLWTTASLESRYYYGYYDLESQLGYTLYSGVTSNASVDIMVEN